LKELMSFKCVVRIIGKLRAELSVIDRSLIVRKNSS